MKRRHRHTTRSPNRQMARARGFTLIEAALTTVIVGTGVLAIVAAQQAYHQKNDWAQRTGTAHHLANELREMTLGLPMHDPISGTANLGYESNETAGSVGDDGRLHVALGENELLNWDDLDDFAGVINGAGRGSGTVFYPPMNALRQSIDDMENWRQVIEVEGVWPNMLDMTFNQASLDSIDSDTGEHAFYRITVNVQYQDPSKQPQEFDTITELTWVVPR